MFMSRDSPRFSLNVKSPRFSLNVKIVSSYLRWNDIFTMYSQHINVKCSTAVSIIILLLCQCYGFYNILYRLPDVCFYQSCYVVKDNDNREVRYAFFRLYNINFSNKKITAFRRSL